MYTFRKVILLLFCLSLVQNYVQFGDYQKMVAYYQDNSLIPIIQIYHNHHFSTSRQFDEFLSVLQETEYKTKDYARFALIDCEKMKDGQAPPCDEMKRTKDNRKIVVSYPSSEFMNYGGRKIQNPSNSRIFNHPRDVFAVHEFQRLLEEVMPNFFQQMTSLEEYTDWIKPRYTPKIIFLTRQQEIPMVLKKLGTHYFLRFQLAFVSDLTESIINKLTIKSFPQLLAVKFNYATGVYEMIPYKNTDFSGDSYHKIKQFLQPFALEQPRKDIILQRIKISPEKELKTLQEKSEVSQFLDNANGWTIISQIKGEPAKLKNLKQKYGRFFDYIHLQNGDQNEVMGLYDSQSEKTYPIQDEIQFKVLQKDDFLQSTAVWLAKNYVVISVRQKYSHICAIEHAALFRGLTHCLIIKEQDYEAASQAMKIPFDIGFACFQSTHANPNEKIIGRNFKNGTYEEVYGTVEYLTLRKSGEIVEDFKAQPVKQIQRTDNLSNFCVFHNKKCAFLFTHGNKRDRTAFEYLQEIAINYINQYDFFEVDLSCNSHFEQEISNLKNNYGGLIVYHPKAESYVSLKARLSKSNFQKFLKANLSDNKKLPFHAFSSNDIKINKCQAESSDKAKENVQSDSL